MRRSLVGLVLTNALALVASAHADSLELVREQSAMNIAWARCASQVQGRWPADRQPSGVAVGKHAHLSWVGFAARAARWGDDWIIVFFNQDNACVGVLEADSVEGPITCHNVSDNQAYFQYEVHGAGTGISTVDWILYRCPDPDAQMGDGSAGRQVFSGIRRGYMGLDWAEPLSDLLFGKHYSVEDGRALFFFFDLHYRLVNVDGRLMLQRQGAIYLTSAVEQFERLKTAADRRGAALEVANINEFGLLTRDGGSIKPAF